MASGMKRTFITKANQYGICRKLVPSAEELGAIFRKFCMESKRRIIVREPEPVAPVRVPPRAPPTPQRKVAPKPAPKPRKPRLKPLTITITVLHTPNSEGNDVLFEVNGDAPKDIDVNEFEDYIAAFFGQEDECDEEYEDDEFYEE